MTLEQIRLFIAVARNGGFQAAARKLHISQPAVSNAVKNLEHEFAVPLFSREGYRAELTWQGHAILERAELLMNQVTRIETLAKSLRADRETEIKIAIADIIPMQVILDLLKQFYHSNPDTRLKLNFEAVRGASESVMLGEADMGFSIFMEELHSLEHHIIGEVELVPVCAKDHPAAKLVPKQSEDDLRPFVQVVVKDTAKKLPQANFGVISGAQSYCTVHDQNTKKQIILAGLGWGRLPRHIIQEELKVKTLISLANRAITSAKVSIAVIRNKDRHLGPVGTELWQYLAKTKFAR